MSIIYISDFDLRGSGYMNIAVKLCEQLHWHGYDVIALGLGYNGQEHDHPFRIAPITNLQDLIPMVRHIRDAGTDIEAIIVALDVPLQEQLLREVEAPNSDLPYIGIFPLEAPPVCGPWAINLMRMDARLVMSRFAQEALESAGVDSEFIPIGTDTESWRPPSLEERAMLRQGLGVEDNAFAVLSVADNQERKNLSRAIEIFADYVYGFEVERGQEFTRQQKENRKNAYYWLVTRPKSVVGWKLEDYAADYGILDRLMIWERGISFKQLWSLYAAADVMLLTSKAEGLAMPVLEAMSTRLPVIGTGCTAIKEHLTGGKGLLIEPDYVMVDPWGNSNRYLAGREDGVYKLKLYRTGMGQKDIEAMMNKAQEYVAGRTWDKAGDVLASAIERISNGQTETA